MNGDTFTHHVLTEEQELAGSILSHEQMMVLDNLACSTAEEIITQSYLLSDQDRLIKLARAQGQLEILKYLVERSKQLTAAD